MQREKELEIANYQDTWAKLYLHLAKAVDRDFGIEGEWELRRAVRQFGIDRGLAQREQHLKAGLKPNMTNLFGKGDLPGDPRFRRNKIKLNPQERFSETLVCPIASMWRDMDGMRLGRLYCEEFHHAKFSAYAPKSQTNLSQTLTQEGDQFCRFSVYLRPGNMDAEERREAFEEYDPEFDPAKVKELPPVSAQQGFTMLCVRIIQNIAHFTLERFGEAGEACIRGALRAFAADLAEMIAARAASLNRPFDLDFVSSNVPLDFAPDGPGNAIWELYEDIRPRKLFEEEFYQACGIPFQN